MDTKAPVWFTVVAVLGLLWNLLGLAMVGLSAALIYGGGVSQMPPEHQAMVAAQPGFTTLGSIVAVLFGTLGCIGLLMRRRWAKTLLLVSLVGLVIQDIGLVILFTRVPLDVVSAVMQALVLVISVALLALAGKAAARGWLR